MDDTARIQLELISEVSTLLTSADIEHCLMGGWALDFLIGRVTRPHDDVDHFVWATDAEKIRHLLTSNGYAYQDYSNPDYSAFFRKHGQLIDFTFLERNEHNAIRVAGPFRDWVLPQTCFSRTNISLNGIKCPVLDAAGQIHIKTELRNYLPDWPERAKDIEDIGLLRQLTD
jgi:hypothetical protein